MSRYVSAAGWLRVGQEQAFIGRTGGIGDELGSAILAARLARDLVRLAFLIERRWAPYSKWLGRAFADLPLAGEVGPPLRAALAATDWREREAALMAAASALLARLGQRCGVANGTLPAPVDQVIDSTDVLTHIDRCRAAARALGLPPTDDS